MNKMSIEIDLSKHQAYNLHFDSTTASNKNRPTFDVYPGINSIKYVQIKKFIVPRSYYVFDAGHNTITINEAGTPFSATIPVGNYNASSLATAIKTALDAASPATVTYTVTISSTTGLMTIAASAGNIQLVYVTTTMSPYIGFTANSATAASITGDAVCQIDGPGYLEIRSDTIQSIFENEVYLNGVPFSNLINTVDMSVPSFNYAFSTRNDQMIYEACNGSLSQVDFYLTRPGETSPVDLNGLGFVVDLVFVCQQKFS